MRGRLVGAGAVGLGGYLLWDALGRPAPDSGCRLLLEAPRTFLLPGGLLLAAWRRREREPVAALGLAVGLSLAVSILASALVLATPLPLEAVSWLIDGLSAMALALALLRRNEAPAELRVPAARARLALGLLLAACMAAEGISQGGFLGQPSDTWMHLAIVRRVLETGRSVESSPMLVGPVLWRYAEGWHALIARAAAGPRGDLREAWRRAPSLTLAALALAFAGLAAEVLPGSWALAIALAGFGAGGSGLRLPASWGSYPAAAGAILFFAALAALWRWVRNGGRADLLLVGLFSLAGLLAHPLEPVLLGAVALALGALAASGVGGLPARAGLRRAALAAGLLAGLGVAHFAPRYAHLVAEAVSAERSDPSEQWLRLPFGLAIVDPRFLALDWRAPHVLLAALGLPWAARGRPAGALVAALAIVALAIPFAPPSLALIQVAGLPPFLASRAAALFPFPFLLAAVAERFRWPGRAVALAACAASLVLSPPQPRLAAGSAEARILEHEPELCALPRGALVATDLVSGDMLAGLCGLRIVAGLSWHSGTAAGQLELRRFLAEPWQSSLEARSFLASRRVDYVLLNPAASAWPGFHQPFYGPLTTQLAAANKRLFAPVFESGGVACFAVLRSGLDDGEPLAGKDLPLPPLPAQPTADAGGFAGYRVLALDGPLRLAPGETGHFELRLAAAGLQREAPLVAFVATPVGFLETTAWQRARRAFGRPRVLHAAGRPLAAYRLDHRVYFDRALRRGEATAVAFELSVPKDLPPGRYALQAGLEVGLPAFPEPLGPALSADFVELRLLDVGP